MKEMIFLHTIKKCWKILNNMNFELLTCDTTRLWLVNTFQKPGVVLIFPITRVPVRGIEASWQNFVELIQRSALHAVVIIDKTPHYVATDYFLGQDLEMKCPGYILQRDVLEGMYDSQRVIELDSNLWITQVHDDDDWSGAIALPSLATQDTVYIPTISDGNQCYELAESIRIPAHTLFSLVPQRLWNSFTAYITAQGGHIAPSADSSLSLVSQAYFKHERLMLFSYKYSARHWEARQRIRRKLIKLSHSDGWGAISGVSAAVLASHMDQICFMMFMAKRDGSALKPDQLATLVKKVTSSKKLRILSLIQWGSTNDLTKEKIPIANPSLGVLRIRGLDPYILKIWFELKLSKVHDLQSLIQLLKWIRILDLSVSLNVRIDFWLLTTTTATMD
jgi:hypothetical protein